jgi:hypothetical protein
VAHTSILCVLGVGLLQDKAKVGARRRRARCSHSPRRRLFKLVALTIKFGSELASLDPCDSILDWRQARGRRSS